MSLRSKIILILSGVVVLYAAFDNGVLRFMASRSFEAWEMEDAGRRMKEARWFLDDSLDDVAAQCRLLAELDVVHSSLMVGGPDAPQDAFEDLLSGDDPLDLLYFCDEQGRVIWGRILDPQTRAPVRLREMPSEALFDNHPLFATARDARQVEGLMLTEREPLLVSRCSVGAAGSESLASVVAGRFFDERMRALFEERSTLGIEIESLTESDLIDRELLDEITSSPTLVSREEGDRLHLWETLSDLRRRPSILLHASLEREIAARGKTAVNYALLSTVGTTLLILLVLLRLLQGIVIRPLSELTTAAVAIGQNDDTSVRVGMERGDEIGLLSKEFDRMLGKLAHSREEVVRTARLAGMSEIATGVLHNVGNVLNSVNVSASLVARKAEQLAVEDLNRLLDVLGSHADDLGTFVTSHPQGKQLLPFLTAVVGELSQQKEELAGEVASLGQGIDHIADLVRSQQSYAGTKGVFEPANLDKQVDAAVKICSQAYGFAEEVELVRDYADLPRVRVDKHKLMEILVNLLQNARQALAEVDRPDKRIFLRTRLEGETARIEVEDNGSGIEPDNLARVFHHGFTTKVGGHGFGLHVSANAATEMGARLRAESRGRGAGAKFVLEVPLHAAGAEAQRREEGLAA